MKTVSLDVLREGMITDCEYYTREGELLLSQGVSIQQHHIDALRRRKVFELFAKESGDDDEIRRLLSAEFKSLDKLELDEEKAAPQAPPQRPRALDRPKFSHIKAGEEGVKQLNTSASAKALDEKLSAGQSSDQPSGPALKQSAREMQVADRTEAYKSEISTSYESALRTTRLLLQSIVNDERSDGQAARGIVEQFVETFINDKDILLNISTIQSGDIEYIYHHSLNVCLLAINIGASYGYSKEQVIEIGMGALLHDVGMLLTPREIRLKQGRLTRDEWFEIQKHPINGLHLLESVVRLPDSVPFIAYQAHERTNGKGYPKQRSGRFLHAYAKIVQIADIFEALSAPRTYRPPQIPYKAMETIIKMTRQGMISGEFVKAFLAYASLFPVGSFIELSDHRIARVINAHPTSYAKPRVSVLTDAAGAVLPRQKIYQIDLSTDTTVQVMRALDSNALAKVTLMDGF